MESTYRPYFVSWLVLLLLLFKACRCQLYEFKRHDLCFLSDRLVYGYSRIEHIEDGDRFRCVEMCKLDKYCVGFSFEGGHNSMLNDSEVNITESKALDCYLHKEFVTNDQCQGHYVESHHKFYMKHRTCENGGEWSEDLQTCQCVGEESQPDIMIGHICTARPRNCRDLSNRGIKPFSDTVYLRLWPYYFHDYMRLVHCTISQEGGTKIQVALNKNTQDEFNETWTWYTTGYEDTTHYWMGLILMHSIMETTVESSTIYMEAKGRGPFHGTAEFYDVKLGPASDGYRVSYSNVSLSGDFAENDDQYCWQYSNNTQFSTYDKDNDGNETENCAALNGVGWWFGSSSCTSPCNLFGSKYFWYPMRRITQPDYSLAQVRIPGFSIRDLAIYFLQAVIEIHA